MFMYGIARSLSLALVSAQLFYSVESIAAKLHVWKHSPSHTINLISSLHSSCFGEVFLYQHHVLEVLMHVFIGFYSFSNGLIIRWDAQVNKAVWFTCTNCCIQFCSATHNMKIGVCNSISVVVFCCLRMCLWWSLCTLYLFTCQARVTTGDSGLYCCVCVKSFKR